MFPFLCASSPVRLPGPSVSCLSSQASHQPCLHQVPACALPSWAL